MCQTGGQADDPGAPSAGHQTGALCGRPAAQRGPVPRVQDHPAAEPLHLAQELLRLRQGDAASGDRRRCALRHGRLRAAAAADPRSAVHGYLRLPPVQQRLHPPPADSLRRGFPPGDPEIVFKFRHPDIQKAAEMDVRPNIPGDYRIKFKAEALPLKDRLGGIRLLYSHNVEFGLSAVPEGDHMSLERSCRPCRPCRRSRRARGWRWSATPSSRRSSRTSAISTSAPGSPPGERRALALACEHRPLIGEFAYQLKFKRREDLNDEALQRQRPSSWACRTWRGTGSPSERRRPGSSID